jgi:hypothetical protein
MLDAAHELAVAGGLGAVRMGAVAARVGPVPADAARGVRHQGGARQALVLRTTERFLLGVHDALEASPGGLREAGALAVVFTLESTGARPAAADGADQRAQRRRTRRCCRC